MRKFKSRWRKASNVDELVSIRVWEILSMKFSWFEHVHCGIVPRLEQVCYNMHSSNEITIAYGVSTTISDNVWETKLLKIPRMMPIIVIMANLMYSNIDISQSNSIFRLTVWSIFITLKCKSLDYRNHNISNSFRE